jgi:hypothetical protein
MDVLLLTAYVSGMRLPSRSLAIGMCHNIVRLTLPDIFLRNFLFRFYSLLICTNGEGDFEFKDGIYLHLLRNMSRNNGLFQTALTTKCAKFDSVNGNIASTAKRGWDWSSVFDMSHTFIATCNCLPI